MSATNESENLYGKEHVRRYRETGGQMGHDWKRGTSTLILSTKGRKSGEQRDTPLIYGRSGDDYVVVASQGGKPQHPAWYLNLREDPNVGVQVWDDVFPARARTATPEERAKLWPMMNEEWPPYDEYQTKTTREIPVVILERR
jgi:deazaflavin-dependent oxidoreductase (nitroreductase family)